MFYSRRIVVLAAALIILATIGSAQVTCTANVTAAASYLRRSAEADLGADLVLSCTGGTPTQGNATVPAVNFTISANTNITSRLLGTGWSEAELLIDEPDPSQQLACATANGVCGMLGTDTGVSTYDGSPGRPNVYQAQTVTNQPNSLIFASIPFDPPGAGTRTLRFVNVRYNVLPFSVADPVTLTVSSSNPTMTILNSTRTVGLAATEMTMIVNGVINGQTGVSQFTVNFTEGFGNAWKKRGSTAFVSADTSPATPNQNSPGFVYLDSETGFYNSGFPNLVSSARGNLALAGLADEGTRLVVRMNNIPNSVTVSGPPTISVTGIEIPFWARLITADINGAGVFTPRGSLSASSVPLQSDGSGNVWAVYEVLGTNSAASEVASATFTLSYGSGAPPVNSLAISGQLGAVSAQNTSGNSSVPVPRFNRAITPSLLGILTSGLPSGVSGANYLATITAAGGTQPYTFTASGLPAGLVISSSGVISGIVAPGSGGTYNVTVTVQDQTLASASRTYSVSITDNLQIITSSLPSGVLGENYLQNILAAGGFQPYRFSVVSASSLPPGLTLSSGGALSGIPTVAGTYLITIGVADGIGSATSSTLTIAIVPPLSFTSVSPLPAGVAGSPYAIFITATGGTTPYVFTFVGTAPSGLTLSQFGGLTAQAPPLGPVSFTVRVTDANGLTATKTFDVSFGPAQPLLQLSSTALNFLGALGGSAPVPQNVQIVSTTGAPISFSTQVDSLPNTGAEQEFSAEPAVERTAAPSWLTITLSGGVTPASMVASVDQTGLAAGTYSARVRFTVPNVVTQAPFDVSIRFVVSDTAARLDVAPRAAPVCSQGRCSRIVATSDRHSQYGRPPARWPSARG